MPTNWIRFWISSVIWLQILHQSVDSIRLMVNHSIMKPLFYWRNSVNLRRIDFRDCKINHYNSQEMARFLTISKSRSNFKEMITADLFVWQPFLPTYVTVPPLQLKKIFSGRNLIYWAVGIHWFGKFGNVTLWNATIEPEILISIINKYIKLRHIELNLNDNLENFKDVLKAVST